MNSSKHTIRSKRTAVFAGVVLGFCGALSAQAGEVLGALPMHPNQIEEPVFAPDSNGVESSQQFRRGDYAYDVTFSWNDESWELTDYEAVRISTQDIESEVVSETVPFGTSTKDPTPTPHGPVGEDGPGPGDFSRPPFNGVPGQRVSTHYDSYRGYTVDITHSWLTTFSGSSGWTVTSFTTKYVPPLDPK